MNGDSLTGMATNDKERDDIVVNEFEAFKAAFDSGNLQAVMVSNVSVPSLSGDNTPSSVSEKVITDELRGTLGFDGIIITSAFTDGAITEYYTSGEAAVEAIKAGADMVYIPENFSEAYEGVLAAVQSGSVSEARIDESLKRIFRVKYSDKVDQISQGNCYLGVLEWMFCWLEMSVTLPKKPYWKHFLVIPWLCADHLTKMRGTAVSDG